MKLCKAVHLKTHSLIEEDYYGVMEKFNIVMLELNFGINDNTKLQDLLCTVLSVNFSKGLSISQLKDLYHHAEICAWFGSASLTGTLNLVKYYLEVNDLFSALKELIVLLLISKVNIISIDETGRIPCPLI